jgi:hypothetical protein
VSARPSVAEERWLTVATRLRGVLPRGALDERSGGWKTTGPIARAALFVAGVLGALMVVGIVMLGSGGAGAGALVVAAVLIVAGSEGLIRGQKLHASGVAEGSYATGLVVFAYWLFDRTTSGGGEDIGWLYAAIALIVAGLRVSNALLSTLGVAWVCGWFGTTAIGGAMDARVGFGATATTAACAIAAAALFAGGRTYARPSTDRMFDALVAGLPLAGLLLGGNSAVARDLVGAGLRSGTSLTVSIVLLVYAACAAVTGVRRRRHAPLYGAMFAAAAALANARVVLGGIDEAWLVGTGLVSLLGAVALDRWLREPRDGFTSAKITSGEGLADLVQLAGVTTLRAPEAPAGAPPSDVTPGGGRYGGGGASGSF